MYTDRHCRDLHGIHRDQRYCRNALLEILGFQPVIRRDVSNEISRGYFLNVLVVDLALEIIIAGDCQAVDEDMDMRTAARQPARPFLRRLSTLPGRRNSDTEQRKSPASGAWTRPLG